MEFEKFVPPPTKRPPARAGRRTAKPPTVALTEETYAALAAAAIRFDVSLERFAQDALAIGIRAILARSETYNRRVFAPPTLPDGAAS